MKAGPRWEWDCNASVVTEKYYPQMTQMYADKTVPNLCPSTPSADGLSTVYAYDAYLIVCAQQSRAPLLTLDRGLARSARRVGVTVLEVA